MKDRIAVQDSQTAPTTVVFSDEGRDGTSDDEKEYDDHQYNTSNLRGLEFCI